MMSAVDEYTCPEPGCDFDIYAVGDALPGYTDEMREEIDEHRRSHAARPFQVRVRVRQSPADPWHEGPVYSIDEQSFLFVKTAPWIQHDGTEVDVDFVIMNDARTAAAYSYEIELLEPAPTIPSGSAVTQPNPALPDVPSLVALDRAEAAERLADATDDMLHALSLGVTTGPVVERLYAALDNYRQAVGS